MIPSVVLFLLSLLIVAAVLQADFAFTILYLFAGVFVLSQRWVQRSLEQIEFRRRFDRRAFLGEEVQVELELKNPSWLPAVWLQVQDALPLEVSYSSSFRQVVSIGGRSSLTLGYTLNARKRGFYPIGPLKLSSGDLFGLGRVRERQEPAAYLTVYPDIVPLPAMQLPTGIPLGTLAYGRPIFEDPNRPAGKRPYVVGDSQRRVDWKATASSGGLQVKTYEPSISMEVSLFLGLNPDEYVARRRSGAIELAVVAAASLSNWIIERRQAAGLVTNGIDPHHQGRRPPAIPPRKGRENLVRILETLARIQPDQEVRLVQALARESGRLSWGTSLAVLCGQVTEELFDELIAVRRRGLRPVLLPIGPVENLYAARLRARQAGIPFHPVYRAADLRTWGARLW